MQRTFPSMEFWWPLRAALLEPSAHGFLSVYLMFRAECPRPYSGLISSLQDLTPPPPIPGDPEWSPLSAWFLSPGYSPGPGSPGGLPATQMALLHLQDPLEGIRVLSGETALACPTGP